MSQKDLFGKEVKPKRLNKIEDHWINMPEYNNPDRQKPVKAVIVKFRTEDDFKEFSRLMRELIFNGDLRWGTFRSNVHVTWYPPFENTRSDKYFYVDEDDEDIDALLEAEEEYEEYES